MASDHIISPLNVTLLSQRLKADRNFLKWMTRRYKETNPEQAAALETAAEMTEKLRSEILAGGFDEELFTGDELPELWSKEAEIPQPLDRLQDLDFDFRTSTSTFLEGVPASELIIDVGGYYCPEPECLRQRGHSGPHDTL